MEWINYLKYLLTFGFAEADETWVTELLYFVMFLFYVCLGGLALFLVFIKPSILLLLAGLVIYRGYLDWKKENTDE